ncbi:hypothetical protein CLAFUW4_14824 [Fulvia fulva]|nr:hypothetical protein CLAFUR0_14817 [Fulvia fulva]WPV23001.1 hypothetical protein CLAFUW4_14824 [Fulvia fulva]WPV37950.1 hypothetical protein CLAFUW7_14825 [Fulvia fulva]
MSKLKADFDDVGDFYRFYKGRDDRRDQQFLWLKQSTKETITKHQKVQNVLRQEKKQLMEDRDQRKARIDELEDALATRQQQHDDAARELEQCRAVLINERQAAKDPQGRSRSVITENVALRASVHQLEQGKRQYEADRKELQDQHRSELEHHSELKAATESLQDLHRAELEATRKRLEELHHAELKASKNKLQDYHRIELQACYQASLERLVYYGVIGASTGLVARTRMLSNLYLRAPLPEEQQKLLAQVCHRRSRGLVKYTTSGGRSVGGHFHHFYNLQKEDRPGLWPTAIGLAYALLMGQSTVFFAEGPSGAGKSSALFLTQHCLTAEVIAAISMLLLRSKPRSKKAELAFTCTIVEAYETTATCLLSGKVMSNTQGLAHAEKRRLDFQNDYAQHDWLDCQRSIKDRRKVNNMAEVKGDPSANKHSSRAHTVCEIVLGQRYVQIVDLCGSEEMPDVVKTTRAHASNANPSISQSTAAKTAPTLTVPKAKTIPRKKVSLEDQREAQVIKASRYEISSAMLSISRGERPVKGTSRQISRLLNDSLFGDATIVRFIFLHPLQEYEESNVWAFEAGRISAYDSKSAFYGWHMEDDERNLDTVSDWNPLAHVRCHHDAVHAAKAAHGAVGEGQQNPSTPKQVTRQKGIDNLRSPVIEQASATIEPPILAPHHPTQRPPSNSTTPALEHRGDRQQSVMAGSSLTIRSPLTSTIERRDADSEATLGRSLWLQLKDLEPASILDKGRLENRTKAHMNQEELLLAFETWTRHDGALERLTKHLDHLQQDPANFERVKAKPADVSLC